MLHLIFPQSSLASSTPPAEIKLNHYEYIAALPAFDQLRTPLFYTPDELALLRGTNIHGATSLRKDSWEKEFTQTKEILRQEGTLLNSVQLEKYTWCGFFKAWSHRLRD